MYCYRYTILASCRTSLIMPKLNPISLYTYTVLYVKYISMDAWRYTAYMYNLTAYSYRQCSRTTAVFFSRKRIYCLLSAASGNRSVFGSKKIAVVRYASILLFWYGSTFYSKFSISLFPLTYPLDVFNIIVRQVGQSGRHLSTLWRQ